MTLDARFFRTEAGNEPVREWLTCLPRTMAIAKQRKAAIERHKQ
ncbi:hypothetical protein [Pseudomonas sp. AFG_SD02_1510_Pfu_092]|nr:hypothetical protein [Pseudomonas sp. AFG_SD02_1510_Pfu_092]